MSASVGMDSAAFSTMSAHSAAAASAVAVSGVAIMPHVAPHPAQRVITTRPQVPISDQELRARVTWGHETSPHFSLTFDRVSFTPHQADTLLAQLETSYSQIFHLTHESFADRCAVYAIDQRATGLLGCAVHPHYNSHERAIYLIETSRHRAECDLVRTVTHAMRHPRFEKHYYSTPGWAALEEGFSIFLTERLGVSASPFPLYGTQHDLVASHLTTKGHTVAGLWNDPLTTFTSDQLALLGAFFLYLGDTFSDDRVVAFSKSEDAITAETFRAIFGEALDELEYAWTQRLPLSLVALMQSEQDALLQKWEQAIEGHRHS
jgi:hypothetical protein